MDTVLLIMALAVGAALWGAFRNVEVHYETVRLICPVEMSVARVLLAGDPKTGFWTRVCDCDLAPAEGCEQLCARLLNDETPIRLP